MVIGEQLALRLFSGALSRPTPSESGFQHAPKHVIKTSRMIGAVGASVMDLKDMMVSAVEGVRQTHLGEAPPTMLTWVGKPALNRLG